MTSPLGVSPAPADADAKAADAILAAAAELFTSSIPSKVTLREVAEHAGVNYGLIHRHFGTKEALLVALFRRLTGYGATHIRRSGDAIEATEQLFDASAGGFARLFASVALDGSDAGKVFGDTSALEAYAKLIEQQWAVGEDPTRDETFDPSLVAGFVMLNIMVWDLFAPYIQTLAGAEDRPLPELRDEMLRIMQRTVIGLGPSHPPEG
jgi:AcrR family transcriptional regulator